MPTSLLQPHIAYARSDSIAGSEDYAVRSLLMSLLTSGKSVLYTHHDCDKFSNVVEKFAQVHTCASENAFCARLGGVTARGNNNGDDPEQTHH